MELVKYALKFRISFYVLAILMTLGGIGASIVMPKDVLPTVDIPVVVIVWTYTGLDTTDMTQRITTYSEYSLSNNVNNIKRMESQTLQGVAIEKLYFDQSVSIDLAIAQVVSAMNSIRAVMPPGVQPPVIMRFSASSVPVIQLALSSEKETQSQLYDYAMYRIRQTLTQVPGSTLPGPYGGAPRQIMVDLDLQALQANGLTPLDVANAVGTQSLVVPSGLSKIGDSQYPIRLNSTPEAVTTLNEMPIKVVKGTPILLRDVAYVRDGAPPQLNIVRADGQRSILTTILKNGAASTLSVVDNVKRFLPDIRAAAPPDMHITPLFDQSVFVSEAIKDVIREALTAAALTGLTILLFLGSWRSTLIVLVSIPLSILTSLSILAMLGQTINIMTLGGLALAVGILVDDATVAIENTYRLMEEGEGFREAVVGGAAGIAKPALISTLAICSAFVSVLFLTDTPKYLFTPQALAVVFAMLTSYVLSRTLVPILIDVLVKKEYDERFAGHHGGHSNEAVADPTGKAGFFTRFHAGFERGFAKFHRGYLGLLHGVITHRVVTLGAVLAVFAGSAVLFTFVGQDYFPQIDAGAMTLHVRTRSGMRIEATEQVFASIEDTIREVIPAKELGIIVDNIGLPALNYNFAFGDGSFVAYNDGQMLISLAEEHESTLDYMKKLRPILRERFPDVIFYFQPADIITQILDFGTITSVDVQVLGRHEEKDLEVAKNIERRLRAVRGAVDVHIQQITDAPEFYGTINRQMAQEIGLSTQQLANSLNISLGGSFQVTPNFWADPKNGIAYQLWVQTPEYRNASFAAVQNTPLFANGANNSPGVVTLLQNVTTLQRQTEQTVVNHVNTQPKYDVFASVQDRDLGSVRSEIDKIIADEQKNLQPPDRIQILGQIQDMDNAFHNIELGLGIALIAVYLLMAINYQSWGDPFVVLAALPLAFCGIIMSLFITQTTFSIPSLFGAIMSVGVASANSILLVTFAKEYREETGCGAVEAALKAGETRLRPVLMTAGAMFIGLLPMAIGVGAGSEQNAALARAVLGGVAVATCSTLLFVPFLYSVLRNGKVEPVKDYL
ncbi:efflux RND transporter permease subunit [Beijerinckia indica]|uniref:Acriflavin resistance protein n=1 Tax=Beijerinckia indica subsp. indica (strain ATCC 9039 / DSM 1715 / NCIMB 8712) TaxID=395963 RepID=B2IKG7_BEII9|nr:efflux RND transporter permease subunit [Beijerinckia indica]ACB96447.1 acriflavin resistance protein [Beijerinckia indica subsp. indica ATCC 9039]